MTTPGSSSPPYDVCRCMAEITFDPKLHPDMEGFYLGI